MTILINRLDDLLCAVATAIKHYGFDLELVSHLIIVLWMILTCYKLEVE